MSECKKGLILEGGAMRGLFTAGVIDVFLENGIQFDGAVGTSAGATFGCNFKSRQPGRVLRYNKKYAGDSRYCSISSLIKTGNLYNADFCYRRLPDELDQFDYETYRKNPLEFYCVVTDVVTGKPMYKKLDTCDQTDLTWMRASASMPLVSKVVEVDGYKLLDGGITDSIPLAYFEELGYNKNVVVLTQPRKYEKQRSGALWLMKLLLKKYPEVVKAMEKRHEVYNLQKKEVFEKADREDLIVICPEKPLGISRTEKNPDELQRCYDLGRRAALTNLERVRSFLKN